MEEQNTTQTTKEGISIWGWPIALIGGVYLLDQLSKWIIIRNFEIGDYLDVIPGFFDLIHVRNTGAAWSILSDYTWILSMVSVFAFVAMIALFKQWNKGSKWVAALVAILIGGVAGNMTDRIFRHSVVDFLDFHFQEYYHWPAFNIADSAICVSIILLVIITWIKERQSK